MRTPQSSQLKAHLIIPIQPPKLCGFLIAKEFIQVYIKKSRNMAMESVRTKGFFRGAKICCCFNCFAFWNQMFLLCWQRLTNHKHYRSMQGEILSAFQRMNNLIKTFEVQLLNINPWFGPIIEYLLKFFLQTCLPHLETIWGFGELESLKPNLSASSITTKTQIFGKHQEIIKNFISSTFHHSKLHYSTEWKF